MANSMPSKAAAGTDSRYLEVARDTQHAQNEWKKEATSRDVGRWLDDLPSPSPRASTTTAPTPAPSPAVTGAFHYHDFTSYQSGVRRVNAPEHDAESDCNSARKNTSILHHPIPQRAPGILVGIGQAQSIPACLGASMRMAPSAMSPELRTGRGCNGEASARRSSIDRYATHAEPDDDGSTRVDSGVGEEDGEWATNDNGTEKPVSFVSQAAERLEEFVREKLKRMSR
jgi:hypothetical protein